YASTVRGASRAAASARKPSTSGSVMARCAFAVRCRILAFSFVIGAEVMSMQFTLLLWGDPDGEAALAPEGRRAVVEGHVWFAAGLRAAGAHRFGAPLEAAGRGRLVRDGLVTDGPFTETKEQLGGLYVIECPTEDAALEWARKVPLSPRLVVEVRA